MKKMKSRKNIHNLWVVIPTYNRSADLLECLDSLCKTVIDRTNIIVVDNNSQDDTKKIVKEKYPEVVLITLDENLGATGAANIGFEYALREKADYVLRLDSDTIVAQDFITPLLDVATSDPSIGILSPKIYYYDPPDEIWYAGVDAQPLIFGATNEHRHERDNPGNSTLREVAYIWAAAMLIRSEVLQETGGFDTDFFVYYEEVDFCERVRKIGYKLIFVPDSFVWHKVGSAANNAWTAYHWNRSKMLLFRKHARNFIHRIFLIIYAYGYAIIDHLIHLCKLQKKSGNRGPLRHALHGLWDGLKITY